MSFVLHPHGWLIIFNWPRPPQWAAPDWYGTGLQLSGHFLFFYPFCPIQPVCCVDLCKVKHLHISELYNHSAPVFPSSSIMQICDRSPEDGGKAWEAVPTSLDSSWLLAVNCKCVPDDRAAHLSTAFMKHCSPTPLSCELKITTYGALYFQPTPQWPDFHTLTRLFTSGLIYLLFFVINLSRPHSVLAQIMIIIIKA